MILEFVIEDMSDLSKVMEENLGTLNISEEEDKPEKGETSERTKDDGEEASVRSKDDGEEASARSKDDGEEAIAWFKDNDEPIKNQQIEWTYETQTSRAKKKKTVDLESEVSAAVSEIFLTLYCFVDSQLISSQLLANLT